jgi:hypothetical protein
MKLILTLDVPKLSIKDINSLGDLSLTVSCLETIIAEALENSHKNETDTYKELVGDFLYIDYNSVNIEGVRTVSDREDAHMRALIERSEKRR